MTVHRDVASLLGAGTKRPSTASPFSLIDSIEGGLPIAALDRVADLVAPSDAAFRFRIVPRATLTRRRSSGRLSAEEGAKVARLARIWSLAVDVWGSAEAARAFLHRPHAMLEDHAPLDVVVRSEIGGELVTDILGRLKYGTAA
jgi:putative toxin-antitoxin system antitoxin component, TIGR02293 family